MIELAQSAPRVTLAVRPFGEQPCGLRGNRILEGNQPAGKLQQLGLAGAKF